MIYFIQCGLRREGGPIKIGYACSIGDCERRRTTLQTGNHLEIFLVAIAPGSYDREAELHERFKAARIRGEWFRADAPGLRGLVTRAVHEEALIADVPLVDGAAEALERPFLQAVSGE